MEDQHIPLYPIGYGISSQRKTPHRDRAHLVIPDHDAERIEESDAILKDGDATPLRSDRKQRSRSIRRGLKIRI
jgi:hypothetical protein